MAWEKRPALISYLGADFLKPEIAAGLIAA